MKILIDECLPRKLKNGLTGHEVQTVPEVGWAGKKNGELLALMSGVFDLFITIDNNLEYQRQLQKLPISFVVLSAPNNKLATLQALMPDVLEALKTIQPGQVVLIRK